LTTIACPVLAEGAHRLIVHECLRKEAIVVGV
jgi:hypothetical protein